jgi:hypothetical protein
MSTRDGPAGNIGRPGSLHQMCRCRGKDSSEYDVEATAGGVRLVLVRRVLAGLECGQFCRRLIPGNGGHRFRVLPGRHSGFCRPSDLSLERRIMAVRRRVAPGGDRQADRFPALDKNRIKRRGITCFDGQFGHQRQRVCAGEQIDCRERRGRRFVAHLCSGRGGELRAGGFLELFRRQIEC